MRTASPIKKRRDGMGATIRARFSHGVLEPLEHVDIREGEVLTITIMRLPTKGEAGGLERSAGGWKGLIDAEELKRNTYADRFISTR
jgi:predicted DNA-binding antitoxin AbrB/MazE fold protein